MSIHVTIADCTRPSSYVCYCTPVTADGAEWEGLGGAVVPAPWTLLYLWSYPEEVEQSKVGPACDIQYDSVTAITVAMHQDFGPLSLLTEQYQC